MPQPGYPPAPPPSYPQGPGLASSANPAPRPPTSAREFGGSYLGGPSPTNLTAPPAKAKRKGPLIGGIVGGVAVLVIAAILLGTVVRPGRGNPSTPPPVGDMKTSDGVVRMFLAALAAGDAEKALATAKQAPSDTTFLTNDVVAAAAKSNPITAIEAKPGTGDQVTATYKLGVTPVTTTFTTSQVGDEYKIDKVAYEVDLSTFSDTSVPLMINGVKSDGITATLFPGIYAVTTPVKWLAYGTGKLTVASPTTEPDTTKLAITMTQVGKEMALKTANDHLAKCKAAKDLWVSSCWGKTLRGGRFDPGKVRYRSSATFTNAPVFFDGDVSQIRVEPKTPITIFVNGPGVLNGKPTPDIGAKFTISRAVVDLSKATPTAILQY